MKGRYTLRDQGRTPTKFGFVTFSSAEVPAGHLNKNSKRAGDDEKREKAGASSLSPSHRPPSAFISPSPQPPYDKKRPVLRWRGVLSDKSTIGKSDVSSNKPSIANMKNLLSMANNPHLNKIKLTICVKPTQLCSLSAYVETLQI